MMDFLMMTFPQAQRGVMGSVVVVVVVVDDGQDDVDPFGYDTAVGVVGVVAVVVGADGDGVDDCLDERKVKNQHHHHHCHYLEIDSVVMRRKGHYEDAAQVTELLFVGVQ